MTEIEPPPLRGKRLLCSQNSRCRSRNRAAKSGVVLNHKDSVVPSTQRLFRYRAMRPPDANVGISLTIGAVKYDTAQADVVEMPGGQGRMLRLFYKRDAIDRIDAKRDQEAGAARTVAASFVTFNWLESSYHVVKLVSWKI
jgi:hypothetical protein